MNKLIYFFTLLICFIFLFGQISAAETDIHIDYFKINNTNNNSIFYGQEIEFDIMLKNYSIVHSYRIPNIIIDATYDDGNYFILKEIETNDSLYLLRTRLISYDYKNTLEIPNLVNICATLVNNDTNSSEKICNKLKVIDPVELIDNTKFDFVNNNLVFNYDIKNLDKKLQYVNLQIDYYLPSGKKTITKDITLKQSAVTNYSNEIKIQELLEKTSFERNTIQVCSKLIYEFNTIHTIEPGCSNINIQKAIPFVTRVDLWPEVIYVDSKVKCNPEFYLGAFSKDELNISYQWTHSGKTYNSFKDNYDCSKQKCKIGDAIECNVKLNVKETEYSKDLSLTKIVQDFPNIDLNNKIEDKPVIIVYQNEIINDNNTPVLTDQNQITTTIEEPQKKLGIFKRFWNWLVNLFN